MARRDVLWVALVTSHCLTQRSGTPPPPPRSPRDLPQTLRLEQRWGHRHTGQDTGSLSLLSPAPPGRWWAFQNQLGEPGWNTLVRDSVSPGRTHSRRPRVTVSIVTGACLSFPFCADSMSSLPIPIKYFSSLHYS